MGNLVQVGNNGQLVVSSRQIAEHFGKRNVEVMDAIRHIQEQMSSVEFPTLFFESSYVASNGKRNPEYLMNRDGFSLLAMGFTGKKALEWKLKYIQSFNDMEQHIKNTSTVPALPQTFAEALRLAAAQAEELEQARPAVAFVERYVSTENTKSIRETAKILDIPERRFIDLLVNRGIVYRCQGVIVPFSTYQKKGYFEVKTGERHGHAFHQTRFTSEGVSWIGQYAHKNGW